MSWPTYIATDATKALQAVADAIEKAGQTDPAKALWIGVYMHNSVKGYGTVTCAGKADSALESFREAFPS